MRKRPSQAKIAHLPEALRLEVNRKLRDNVTTKEIVSWLQNDHGSVLKERNITNLWRRNINTWRRGGYAEWLAREERLEEMKARQEFAFEIARRDNHSFQKASLTVAASQVYETLEKFDLAALHDRLRDKPELYPILIDSISKLTRAGVAEKRMALDLRKYRDKVAEAKRKMEAALGKAQPGGGLSPAGLKTIQDAVKLL